MNQLEVNADKMTMARKEKSAATTTTTTATAAAEIYSKIGN